MTSEWPDPYPCKPVPAPKVQVMGLYKHGVRVRVVTRAVEGFGQGSHEVNNAAYLFVSLLSSTRHEGRIASYDTYD